MSAISQQVNDVLMGQASWLSSIEQHLTNKELQMAHMAETVGKVSRIVQEKNQRIRALLSQN